MLRALRAQGLPIRMRTGDCESRDGLSGGVRRSDNPEQIDVKTPYDTGKAGNRTFVRLKSKQNLLHPGELLVNHLQTSGRRQNTAFDSENRGFLAIHLLDRFHRAIMACHTLAKRKNDQQQA